MFKQRERTRDREEGLVLMAREGKRERKSTKKQRLIGIKDKIGTKIIDHSYRHNTNNVNP